MQAIAQIRYPDFKEAALNESMQAFEHTQQNMTFKKDIELLYAQCLSKQQAVK